MRNWRFQLHCAFRISHFALAVLNVALTGNIAAGKSTVVDLFHKWGATIIDADALVREAQAPGSAVLAAIAGRFGTDVLASDPALEVTVDVDRRVVLAPGAGIEAPFPLDDFTRWRLLEGLDDIGLTLRHLDAIAAYESGRPAWMPTLTAPAGGAG